MSQRDYAWLWLGASKTVVGGGGGATAGGGNILLKTPPHKLDGPEHTTPDDTATLDSTTTQHGLLPKLSGAAGDALRGDGTWAPVGTLIKTLTNKSGASVAAGDVVVVSAANADAFTTTTTAQFTHPIGVAQETIANNASGKVALAGYVSTVNTNGSTFGLRTYLETNGSAKQATANTTRRQGSFGVVVSTSANPDALLFGTTEQGGSSPTFGTPALTFDTTNAAGSTDEVIRRDSQIAVFDGTAPVTQAFGDAAATGSAGKTARRDHKHGMPTAAITTSGLTQATAKLLGRTSASTGAIEEISVGSGLSLSGGSLTATGGGGGGSSTNAPDGKPWNFTPPGSANAMDDEFGDAVSQSGPINGLDAKWSKHNLGTAAWLRLSDSYAPGSLGFDIPTGQSTDQWIYQAIPAGACTFAVQFNIEYASDRQMYSLAILDTAGTGVGFRIDTGGGPQIMNITTWQQTSTVVALTPAWNSNTEFWFRPMTLFLRSDGSHNFFASGTLGDRAVRSLLAEVTQNRTFTDAYVAFGRCFGTGVSKATLDYFRRTA